jgi:hypothetical protein
MSLPIPEIDLPDIDEESYRLGANNYKLAILSSKARALTAEPAKECLCSKTAIVTGCPATWHVWDWECKDHGTKPGNPGQKCFACPSPKLDLPQEVLGALAFYAKGQSYVGHSTEAVHGRVLAAFIRRIAGEGDRG